MAKNTEKSNDSARGWAVRSLIEPAERYPNLHPPRLDTSGLSPADAALGLAIYRTTIQRWFTLEYLLDLHLKSKSHRLEPGLKAVLLSGAAQLLFMDRLPGYAIVDEAVGLAKSLCSKQQAGVVNAVLRKMSDLVVKSDREAVYTPARNALPIAGGGLVTLRHPCLPPTDQREWHMAVATSTPRPLLKSWIERYGLDQAFQLAMQAIENPPTVLSVEPRFEVEPGNANLLPHRWPGCYLWTGPHEQMRDFLTSHPLRRVQDPAASLAVASTSTLSLRVILDYCAGRGTKTIQLALAHPNASIFATDVDPIRLADLREVAKKHDNLHIIEPEQAGQRVYDLILLDVPCSNTGVLARRPEARYRYSQQSLGEVIHLQRAIVDKATPWLNPEGAHLLYSTCSIEAPENRKQVDRLIRSMKDEFAVEIISEKQHLPAGTGDGYTDGSYHALVHCVKSA